MQVGRMLDGKYRLERKMTQGGMGEIWEGFDVRLQRRVAIKCMTADGSNAPALRARFELEAKYVAQLQNPHVVQIFDYGIADDRPYFVMEFLQGEDLAARLQRRQSLSFAAVTSLLQQIAKALTGAHDIGIVHGDLKPANIFLALGRQGEETVKILDFGVARLRSTFIEANAGTIEPSVLAGTPDYMSPEQLNGAELDPQSDLWSLAVVAYEALAGRRPFTGSSLREITFSISTDPVPLLAPALRGMPAEVDHLFERALARNPAQRFRSASEMAAAFDALAQSPQRPTKVLIIDDERDMMLLVEQVFRSQIQSAIYEFVYATDGQEAFDQLRDHPDVDVALTDINMPGIDGLTFLRRVGEVKPTLKVVIVSAYSDMSNVRQAMNHGAFDFLVKPIDLQDLEFTLDKVSRSARELRAALRSVEENALLRTVVHSGLLDRLLSIMPAHDALRSEEIEGTVVFVGVCGFTAAIAGCSPEVALRWLNANFDIIVPELQAHEGIVDKFFNTLVMAVFCGDHHVERALSACLATRECLERLAAGTGPESPYHLGIAMGVGSGKMLSGGIGSRTQRRVDYTVIGDSVIRAARLQEEAGRYQILIDEALCQAIRARFECQPAGSRRLPGSAPTVPVYDVVSRITPPKPPRRDPTTVAD